MKELNLIGLDPTASKDLAKGFNHLLADFQLYYQNLRALHWNIRGRSFFELHIKFEELYTGAQDRVDEIAERILTLQAVPLHTFKSYIEHGSLRDAQGINEANEAIAIILEGLQSLLVNERKLLSQAADLGDEGSVSLLSDLISEQEKTVWMLSAWRSDQA